MWRACAAVAVAFGGPPAAGAAVPPAVFAVPASGSATPTVFVTSAAASYEVSVSGVFAYNVLGGLADCGYHDVNQAVTGQEWLPGEVGLLVDGAPAPCGEYRDTHRYSFTVRGTGGRLVFQIADGTGAGDNSGGLVVEVVERAEPGSTPCATVRPGSYPADQPTITVDQSCMASP